MDSLTNAVDLIKTHKNRLCLDIPRHHCRSLAQKFKEKKIITDDDYHKVWDTENSTILVNCVLQRNVSGCFSIFCEALREEGLGHLVDLMEGRCKLELKTKAVQKSINSQFQYIEKKIRADDILTEFPAILDDHTRQVVLAETTLIKQAQLLLHYALKSTESTEMLMGALKSGECGNYSQVVEQIEETAKTVPLQGTENQPSECDQDASVQGAFIPAICEAIQSQKQNMESVVALYGQLEVDATNIPLVHPTYVKTQFYSGIKPDLSEVFLPSTVKTLELEWGDETVAFSDLVTLVKGKKFTALIGPAGCGKTTTSKRLVDAAKDIDLVPFHLQFMHMDYKKELTARQLLMDFLFPDLDASCRESAFSWMIKNPGSCLFIMDGYDQAVWSLENVKPVNASYDTPLTIQQLVANLCCKKFFKESMLIFTSRPHSMLSIPYDLRPDVTIDVKDLSTESMRLLFYAFARERSDELWEVLHANAPQLLDLCHNPLLLQFIIIAALYSSDSNLSSVTTVTCVFQLVLEHLRHSDHARGLDINRLWEPLGRMAYKGMERKTVVFKVDDLKSEGLVDVDVQDLVIIVAHYLDFNQRLFDGDKIIYFIHQLLQEKFAAKYIATYMSDQAFLGIVDAVVAGGHWAMVRRFLCGLLLGTGTLEGRPSLFFSKMLQFVGKKLQSAFEQDGLAEVFVDLLEVSDEVLSEFVKLIPGDVNFSDDFAKSVVRIHAFNKVLVQLKKSVAAIYFIRIKSDKVVNRFLLELKEVKCKLKRLDLSNNPFGNEGLQHLALCVHFIHELLLENCGITDLRALIETVLQRQSKTSVLNLSGNKIGNEGFNQLSLIIHKLEWLNVADCGVTDVTDFCEAISKRDTKMRFLGLRYNALKLSGASSLSKCLEKLEMLSVTAGDITAEGMRLLDSVNCERPDSEQTKMMESVLD